MEPGSFAVNSVWIPDSNIHIIPSIITTTGTSAFPDTWYDPSGNFIIEPQHPVPFKVNIPEPQFDMAKLIEALQAAGLNKPVERVEDPVEETVKELKFRRKLEP